jgi:hypothetical protein
MKTVSYQELKNLQEEKMSALIKECRVFFAFSEKQFEESKTPLQEGEEYKSLRSGGYIPANSVPAWIEGLKRNNQWFDEQLKENNLEEEEILYELYNHECFYTGDPEAVFDMFEGRYTQDQIWVVYYKHRAAANQD